MQEAVHIRKNRAPSARQAPSAADSSSDQPLPIEEAPPRDVHGNLRRDWLLSVALFAACSTLLIWIFRSDVASAIEVWNDSETFGHAFFIFPVTLFLFYRLRHQLAACPPRVAPWGLVLVAGGALFWAAGDLANVAVVKQFAFVALWQSVFLLVLGWRVTRVAIFPLAYLYLMVPFGLSIIPTLQDVTAQMVVHLLRLSGVPVFLEGFHIEIPGGSFLVAEACSGIRYLTVCFALGILAADLFFRSWSRRILFVALSIAVPIVANGIRAFGIVMVAYLGYDSLSVSVDHVIYGFVFLSIVTLLLLGFGALLRDRHNPAVLTASGQPVAAGPVAPPRALLQVCCAAAGLAIIASAHVWIAGVKAPPTILASTLRAPDLGPRWVVDLDAPAWIPKYHGTDAALHQGYLQSGKRVALHVGYYVYQREGAEAVSDLNALSGRSDVLLLSARQRTVQVGTVPVPLNELVVVHDGRTFLVWSWYWIDGQRTNSRLTAKLLEIRALTSGADRSAAVIAISSEVSDNLPGTEALLDAFLQQALSSNGMLLEFRMPQTNATVSG